jgi:hypothetical protein
VLAGQFEERVLQVRLVHAELLSHDLVAGQHGDDPVRRIAGAADHDDIAPADDVGDPWHAGQHGVADRSGRAELDPLRYLDPLGEPGGRVLHHDAALVDQRHPVTEPLGLLHEMADEHDRDPSVPGALDQLPGVAPGLRVKARGQLVEHRDPRAADQRQRDRQPLLLAAGQLPERRVALAGEPERLQQRPPVGGRPVEGAVQVEGLGHPQLGRQLALLELRPEQLRQLCAIPQRVEPQHPQLAAVRLAQPLNAFDGGGLAGAVRAEDPEDLTLGDGE